MLRAFIETGEDGSCLFRHNGYCVIFTGKLADRSQRVKHPQIVSPSAAGSEITIRIQTPDHRLDIGEGVVGRADLLEEIARVYGYERVPATRLADELPPPHRNLKLEHEERLRDLLVELGLQEIVSYRLTTPERERRRLSPDPPPDG